MYLTIISEAFSNFSVTTMLALNPNCIDYYKSVEVNFDNYTIINQSERKYINEPNKNYYEFIEYVKSLFPTINEDNYQIFVEKLYQEAKRIENELISNINNLDLIGPYNINKRKLISVIVSNIYTNKYLEKQKILGLRK